MPGHIQRHPAEFLRNQQVSEMSESDGKNTPLNPNALDVAALALVLTRASGGHSPVTAEGIRRDVDAGAPTNPDGTLNVVHYAAWLVKRMSGQTDGD